MKCWFWGVLGMEVVVVRCSRSPYFPIRYADEFRQVDQIVPEIGHGCPLLRCRRNKTEQGQWRKQKQKAKKRTQSSSQTIERNSNTRTRGMYCSEKGFGGGGGGRLVGGRVSSANVAFDLCNRDEIKWAICGTQWRAAAAFDGFHSISARFGHRKCVVFPKSIPFFLSLSLSLYFLLDSCACVCVCDCTFLCCDSVFALVWARFGFHLALRWCTAPWAIMFPCVRHLWGKWVEWVTELCTVLCWNGVRVRGGSYKKRFL